MAWRGVACFTVAEDDGSPLRGSDSRRFGRRGIARLSRGARPFVGVEFELANVYTGEEAGDFEANGDEGATFVEEEHEVPVVSTPR
jgi:hypothetical protein